MFATDLSTKENIESISGFGYTSPMLALFVSTHILDLGLFKGDTAYKESDSNL